MKALIFNIQKFCLHDGHGIRTTIFFKGCNLRCAWCANPESQSCQLETLNGKVTGRYYTIEEILDEVLKDKPFYDKSGGGVTLSGGEPLMQAEFVIALCDALHASGVSVGLETAAHVPEAVFVDVLTRCDFVQFDLKHWDEEKHRQGTGVGLERILANLRLALSSDVPVTVRIPVIPGFNDSEEDARAFAALLAGLGVPRVELLPFHQLGENKYAQLDRQYAYAGVPQLHNQDIEHFASVLGGNGLSVQIGG